MPLARAASCPASSCPVNPDLPKTNRVVCDQSCSMRQGLSTQVRPEGLHMACSDGGRGRRSVSEEFFNTSVADVAINPDVSE